MIQGRLDGPTPEIGWLSVLAALFGAALLLYSVVKALRKK